MLYVVTGGSGSGKSEYAERLAMEREGAKRIYLATMRVWDEEGKKRVERHRQMRSGKGFETVERFTDLEGFAVGHKNPVILLECMSNLAANEFYEKEEGAARRILDGIKCLQNHSLDLIIVTNEVFSDGIRYDPETERYRKLLGELNCALAQQADVVTEVVYGIPVPVK